MSEENQTVAGQEKKADPKLCGDCEAISNPGCDCMNPKSERYGGRIDEKAAACNLFKHV